ncbi:MAG: cytochrome b/b6 domain-containing protein, partial [Anaerolineae bacterium]|nr:cytochrome b/b6 domain-containing protein [Anaerolineae bacterium]
MNKTKLEKVLRFPIEYRLEHWLVVFAFSLLALTGLVQKYALAALSIALIDLLGGIESVRVLHRFGAILLMLEVVYHLGVVTYRMYVKRAQLSMLPSLQDVADAWQSFRYNLGLTKEPPQPGRYSYEEKFEYWAVVWGMVIMIITGFMLWNPIATARVVPGQVIPA